MQLAALLKVNKSKQSKLLKEQVLNHSTPQISSVLEILILSLIPVFKNSPPVFNDIYPQISRFITIQIFPHFSSDLKPLLPFPYSLLQF